MGSANSHSLPWAAVAASRLALFSGDDAAFSTERKFVPSGAHPKLFEAILEVPMAQGCRRANTKVYKHLKTP